MIKVLFRRLPSYKTERRQYYTQDELVTNTLASGPTKHTTGIYWTKRHHIQSKIVTNHIHSRIVGDCNLSGALLGSKRATDCVSLDDGNSYYRFFQARNQQHKPCGKSRAVGHPSGHQPSINDVAQGRGARSTIQDEGYVTSKGRQRCMFSLTTFTSGRW